MNYRSSILMQAYIYMDSKHHRYSHGHKRTEQPIYLGSKCCIRFSFMYKRKA